MNSVAYTKDLSMVLPPELTQLRQFVHWRFETGKDGKPTKVPYRCVGGKASTTEPKTWSTFDFALECMHKEGHAEGIGFVFTKDDPYCGIDLDNIWRSDADEAPAWARKILDLFSDTYGEASPSDTGYKIWCKARLPENSGHKWIPEPELDSESNGIKPAHIEIYDKERFFTLTGKSNKVRVIADCQDDLTILVRNLETAKGDKLERRGAPPPGTDSWSQQIAEGNRHPTLKSLAGSLVFYGVDPAIIENTLLAISKFQCQGKYDLEHIQKLIDYAIRKEQQKWAK